MALTRAADEGFVIVVEYDALNISTAKVFKLFFFAPVDIFLHCTCVAGVEMWCKKYHIECRDDGGNAVRKPN